MVDFESTGFGTTESTSSSIDQQQQPTAHAFGLFSTANATANDNLSHDFSTEPSANSATTAVLCYPHNFFNTKTGLGPKDQEEAKKLWQYRKHRPASGTVDAEPADGEKMLKEVSGMRERLKSHIERAFYAGARQMADCWNLKVPTTNMTPVTPKDFVNALAALKRVEGSLANERIVYMVCHHFHHPRAWLSSAVDAWCLEEKIKIEYPDQPKLMVGGVRTRQSPYNRGGFGVYARNVKSEIVKQLMRNMLQRCGWRIATKDNSKQSKGMKYEAITIRIDIALTDHTCYVVTMEEDANKKPAAKKKDAGSATMGSSADNPIDVDDAVAFGAHVCRSVGVAVSEAKLQEMWSEYNPQSKFLGLQIDGGRLKSPNGEMSDITAEHAAAAAGGTGESTTDAQQITPSGMTTMNNASAGVTLSNTIDAPASTTESNNPQVNSSAAHFTVQTADVASTLLIWGHLLFEAAAPFQDC